jgi:hypothetical protein
MLFLTAANLRFVFSGNLKFPSSRMISIILTLEKSMAIMQVVDYIVELARARNNIQAVREAISLGVQPQVSL